MCDLLSGPAYLALTVSSLIIGYYLGTGASLFSYSQTAKSRAAAGASAQSGSEDEDEGEGEDSGTEDLTDGDKMAMSRIRAGLMEECKMVLVVRTDLKMDKGKIAAQCGHATLACYKTALQTNPAIVKQWERIG